MIEHVCFSCGGEIEPQVAYRDRDYIDVHYVAHYQGPYTYFICKACGRLPADCICPPQTTEAHIARLLERIAVALEKQNDHS